jgi:hypothetical protein
MKLQFTTESGTVYQLDQADMTWNRMFKAKMSGHTRQEGGTLTEWPDIQIGKQAFLFDTDILPGHVAHAIQTSIVREIKYLEGDIDGTEGKIH